MLAVITLAVEMKISEKIAQDGEVAMLFLRSEDVNLESRGLD